MPIEIDEIGSLMKLPGPMIDRPRSAASAGLAPSAAARPVLTSTARANSASIENPNCASTITAMKVAPLSSMIALMIWTQVVAVIPPKMT